MRSNLSYVYHAPSFHYSPCIVWNDFVKCFVRYGLGLAASWYGIKTNRMFIIIIIIIIIIITIIIIIIIIARGWQPVGMD